MHEWCTYEHMPINRENEYIYEYEVALDRFVR